MSQLDCFLCMSCSFFTWNFEFQGMGAYARHLFDVVYLYGIALNNTNSTDPSVYDNMTIFIPQMVTRFEGSENSLFCPYPLLFQE